MAKPVKKTGIEHLQNDRINWFPGHMNKAVKEIKNNIKLVNIIIEVRDARAPLASGNNRQYRQSHGKPYLIVINKANLADPQSNERWHKWFEEQDESFLFINALDKDSIRQIVKKAKSILHAHRLQSNATVVKKDAMKMMIIGLPNTGKSTIINKLSNRNATKAAATPGQTKQKLWVQVDKNLRVLDTPGVMPPRIDQQIHGMWLAAIHAIPDNIVTPDASASFIIEHLLKIKSTSFQEHYQLESLDIDLIEAIEQIGKRRGCLRAGGLYNYDQIYNLVLGDFRKGALGRVSFELPT